jgi:hypothetical protein
VRFTDTRSRRRTNPGGARSAQTTRVLKTRSIVTRPPSTRLRSLGVSRQTATASRSRRAHLPQRARVVAAVPDAVLAFERREQPPLASTRL